jgi:NADPH:quinone reductase-like Zn-dependent oxidoreductase
MKAWVATTRGNPLDVLELRTDHPQPTSSDLPKDAVLVKVTAAALNPVGYKFMSLLPSMIAKKPGVAEFDIAGVVVDGNGTRFNKGDKVFGVVPPPTAFKTGLGALAQYTYTGAKCLSLRPSNVTDVEAAGFTIAGLAALHCVNKTGLESGSGKTVLINGGSTAVGAYAIQIAKARGLRVVASASGKNEQFVRDLGADEFIDYTISPLPARLSASPPLPLFDAIVDAAGTALVDPSFFKLSPAYLKQGGIIATAGTLPKLSQMGAVGLSIFEAKMRPTWAGGVDRVLDTTTLEMAEGIFDPFVALVKDGKLKPVVDSVYEFEDAKKAYQHHMAGKTRGKVVVRVSAEE